MYRKASQGIGLREAVKPGTTRRVLYSLPRSLILQMMLSGNGWALQLSVRQACQMLTVLLIGGGSECAIHRRNCWRGRQTASLLASCSWHVDKVCSNHHFWLVNLSGVEWLFCLLYALVHLLKQRQESWLHMGLSIQNLWPGADQRIIFLKSIM